MGQALAGLAAPAVVVAASAVVVVAAAVVAVVVSASAEPAVQGSVLAEPCGVPSFDS